MVDVPALSSRVVVAVVGAVIIAGLALDTVVVPAATEVPEIRTTALRAGSTTCAALALDAVSDVTATTVALAGTDEDDPTTASRREDAIASLEVLAEGRRTSLAAPPTDGSARATVVAGAGSDVGLTARWDEAPLLLSRRWTIDETQRVPGTVEGPCPAEPATRWVVPGIVTAGGASATLHLANPTDGPASLAVTFTTPDGPVAPTRLANLAVPARSTTTVDLNQFVPEEPDLGVVVTTRAGRVVVEALQTLEAAVGGVDGRSLVVAHPEPAETWTIPWVRASDVESAWVWVTNPGEAATDVRLVLHTSTGPVVPPDSGVTLPPGTTRRIDLRGALAEVTEAAVTIRSAPGVPVVASGAVLRVDEEDPVRGGIAVVAAAEATGGPQASLSAVGSEGRLRRLVVANPTDQAALVDVRVVGALASLERPVATGVVVPAGGVAEVDLADVLPLEGGFALVVDAVEGAVVATVVAADTEGPLDLMAVGAQPFPAMVRVAAPRPVGDRTLLHPLDGEDVTDAVPATDPSPAEGNLEVTTEVEPAPEP